ncbi:uncharacterized protein [Arachis hypogaea]|uniref:uncharacterized protein n=1 Tax=Arachis hypogaea TaxID=3818 RepID=UPI003B221C3F
MDPDVIEVANALANDMPFGELSFMRVLDLEAMHVPEFPEYMTAKIPIVAYGEFAIGMEFSSREAVIKAIKEKYCWVIRRYNGSHTCTRATISQNHLKLDSITIAEAIKPLIEADPSLKVKSVIAEVQLKFNYTCKGCLLVADSQDGNNNIVPIAFAIVEGETSDAWHFFLSNLRQHVVTRDGVGLISDRHESINETVKCSNGAWSPPRAFHMFCIMHIESNFLRKFKAPYLQKLVVNIGYSRTVREYEVCYQRLREWGEAYTNWLKRIPREQYALAFDGGYRWGHMTTNLVECINSVLKGAHNLPITALVKATFYRLNELFTRKRAEAEARINAGHLFSTVVTLKLHADQLTSENI